jgi:hypothetical protein
VHNGFTNLVGFTDLGFAVKSATGVKSFSTDLNSIRCISPAEAEQHSIITPRHTTILYAGIISGATSTMTILFTIRCSLRTESPEPGTSSLAENALLRSFNPQFCVPVVSSPSRSGRLEFQPDIKMASWIG